MPKKNWTKTKGFNTKRRHRELLAPLNAVVAAIADAAVALTSFDSPAEDDTLRLKIGLVNGPDYSIGIERKWR